VWSLLFLLGAERLARLGLINLPRRGDMQRVPVNAQTRHALEQESAHEPHGPYCGAGVSLKSASSVTHAKLLRVSPRYFFMPMASSRAAIRIA
jgi:hypothetical protein